MPDDSRGEASLLISQAWRMQQTKLTYVQCDTLDLALDISPASQGRNRRAMSGLSLASDKTWASLCEEQQTSDTSHAQQN